MLQKFLPDRVCKDSGGTLLEILGPVGFSHKNAKTVVCLWKLPIAQLISIIKKHKRQWK
jgi:hypothetical protein